MGSTGTAAPMGSSSQNINSTISLPMPTPNTSGAPKFKGKLVSDFLDSLEVHADAARLPHTSLPQYVLRYCHYKVRHVIENSTLFAGHDWVAVRTYLIDLYASNDRAPHVSADRLRLWVKKHADAKSFLRIQDVDRYYREFTSQSTVLLAKSLILEAEINVLFYRGIPNALRPKIKRKLPATSTKISSPPTVASVLVILRKEFDEDDLDANTSDVDFHLNSDSDSSSSSNNSCSRTPSPPPKKKKKTVTFESTTVPATTPVEPITPSSIETLEKQMQELRISQANLQRELASARAQNPQIPERRCFICDRSTHRLRAFSDLPTTALNKLMGDIAQHIWPR